MVPCELSRLVSAGSLSVRETKIYTVDGKDVIKLAAQLLNRLHVRGDDSLVATDSSDQGRHPQMSFPVAMSRVLDRVVAEVKAIADVAGVNGDPGIIERTGLEECTEIGQVPQLPSAPFLLGFLGLL